MFSANCTVLPPHLLLTSVRLQEDHKVKETATFLKTKKAALSRSLTFFHADNTSVGCGIAGHQEEVRTLNSYQSLHFLVCIFLHLATTLNRGLVSGFSILTHV